MAYPISATTYTVEDHTIRTASKRRYVVVGIYERTKSIVMLKRSDNFASARRYALGASRRRIFIPVVVIDQTTGKEAIRF